jgi:hypothetical protein
MPRIVHVIVVAIIGCSSTSAVARGTLMQERKAFSRAAMEALVKEHLAARLKVPVDQIAVVEAADRWWPDEGLGCEARKGLHEPMPVPGFAFTLAHSGTRHVYHTDRSGHFRRCPVRKPLGRIGR